MFKVLQPFLALVDMIRQRKQYVLKLLVYCLVLRTLNIKT